MSDYNYDDEDFDDNSFDDSGVEERSLDQTSFGIDIDVELNKSAGNYSPSLPSKQVRNPRKGKENAKKSHKRDPYKSYPGRLPRRAESDPRGKRRIRPGVKGHSSAKSTAAVESTSQGSVIKSLLSANKQKSSSMHNKIHELRQQCEVLAIENRDLRRNVRIQDRDLKKLDGAEAQLPTLVKRHGSEMRVIEEKYKKQKEISSGLSENIRKVDNELVRAKDRLKECQAIIKEKNLRERVELKNNVLDLEQVLREKDSKISELNRTIALEKKSHDRLIKEKNEKHKKATQKLKSLQGKQNNLQVQVREKEKALGTDAKSNKENEQKQIMFSVSNYVPTSTPIYEQPKSKMIEIPVSNKEEKSNSQKLSSTKVIDTMVSENYFKDFSTDLNSNVEPIFLTEGLFGTGNAGIEDDNKEYKRSLITDVKVDTENGGIFKGSDELSQDKKTYFELHAKQPIATQKNKDNDSAHDESRKLLLAKMNAIDKGENPEYITEENYSFPMKRNEEKAKPIFLQKSPESITPMAEPEPEPEPEMLHLFGQASNAFSGTTDNSFSHVPKNSRYKKSGQHTERNISSSSSEELMSENPKDLKNDTIDDYSMYSHYGEDYSTTGLGNNTTGLGKRNNKKGTLGNIFDQFEDPFRID